MSETIIAAAIKSDDGETIYSLPAPKRHHHILHEFFGKVSLDVTDQGFLTNSGRFVDRKEALSIAISSGQIKSGNWPHRLFSEDLW